MLIRSEEAAIDIRIDLDQLGALRRRIALEELAVLVEAEGSRMLLLVDHVGAGARRDHHGAGRDLHDRPRILPSAILDDLFLEEDRFHVAELVGDRFDRREIFGIRNSFFKGLDHFFVIQPIGGRIDQQLAIDDGDAAP